MEKPRTEALSADQTGQIDSADFPKPEDPNKVLSRKRNPITTTTLGVLLVFVALFIVGLADKFDWLPCLPFLTNQKGSITLISSNSAGLDSIVLMVIQRGEHSEVRTLNTDTGSTDFLSDPTAESFAPVYSPTGDQIALFVRDTSDQILLVVDQPGGVFTETITVNTLGQINKEGFELCDYAQAVWSTDGQRIATFVCNKQSKESYLLVTEIGGANEILEKTQDNLDRVRSVVWIGPTRVVYTQNERNLDVVYLLDILNPNQPVRLFGP